MGDARAGRKWPCVCGLLLLLLWGTTASQPERGAAGQDRVPLQEGAEVKANSLLTFLAWWHEWTAQAHAGALIGGDTSNIAKRQEDPPLQQPPRREKTEKTRCKNFFWKTFSSCK
ncbi:cortistatin [Dipodomys spectabilis]|uniref:cortistatin n=1 Tax=Dipodomys spectabilis TaxID=105255 RepID=UPI001C547456|nr:cortistatin [Dipodomys spectabilis]